MKLIIYQNLLIEALFVSFFSRQIFTVRSQNHSRCEITLNNLCPFQNLSPTLETLNLRSWLGLHFNSSCVVLSTMKYFRFVYDASVS